MSGAKTDMGTGRSRSAGAELATTAFRSSLTTAPPSGKTSRVAIRTFASWGSIGASEFHPRKVDWMRSWRLRIPVCAAILSAVIFNAVIIIALIPLALKGVVYRPVGAEALLRRNLLIYGVGGVIAPFVGIKLIDMLLTAVGLA